jgi:hypothetical protein
MVILCLRLIIRPFLFAQFERPIFVYVEYVFTNVIYVIVDVLIVATALAEYSYCHLIGTCSF